MKINVIIYLEGTNLDKGGGIMVINLEKDEFCVFCDPRKEIREMNYEKAQELIKKGKFCSECAQFALV